MIDFKGLNFPPIDDEYKQGDDPRTYFTRYENIAEYDKVQVKCWKAGPGPVTLTESGGHQASFEGRRVFPIQFLLRHYPIRGQRHGTRKVFAERKGRFAEKERSKGWHVQYDHIKDDTHSFLRDPAVLHPFDLDRVRHDLLTPEGVLRNLADRLIRADEQIDALGWDKQHLQQQASDLARECEALKAALAERDGDRERLEAQAETLRMALAEREQLMQILLNSRSWRYTAPLRALKRIADRK